MAFDPYGAAADRSMRRESEVRALCSADPALASFHVHATTASLSTNVSGDKLETFLERGEVLPTRAVLEHLAGGNADRAHDTYRNRQGDFLIVAGRSKLCSA